MADEKRRHKRLKVLLPLQGQVADEEVALEVIDISCSGMQIRSRDFEGLKRGFDTQKNRATFEIEIPARLAWSQNIDDDVCVTGWEFVFQQSEAERGLQRPQERHGKRKHPRLPIALTVHAHVGDGTYEAIEVVDISPSGMQLKCRNFDVIRAGIDTRSNQARFNIRVVARLAWAQSADSNGYLTGWEFDLQNGEARIA